MTYYTGSVAAVPTANKDAYLQHAKRAWPYFQRTGALRMVETWGDDVQPGKVTDFRRAVQAKDDETVVFSWIEWPDKATSDKAWQTMMADEDMGAKMGDMPFDGKRMIFGGFEPFIAEGTDKGAGWYQGFLTPGKPERRKDFEELAHMAWNEMFKPSGALGSVESWGVEVPTGKVTDMYRAVNAEPGEEIVFSWSSWPDRATCDKAAADMEGGDHEMPADMPFDGKRMVYAGFSPLYDSAAA